MIDLVEIFLRLITRSGVRWAGDQDREDKKVEEQMTLLQVGQIYTHADCNFVPERFFGMMPERTHASFKEISVISFFPQGTLLFIEGQESKGVFVLCSGKAKLSISSGNGKSLMRVAEPGEILGLGATISGRAYEVSAEMLEGGQVNFIKRENFLEFLRHDVDVSLKMAQQLSQDYFKVHEQVRTLALTDSVLEKLATLLLSWCEKDGRETENGIQLKVSLTHGEMAQMIGVSRETVTRLLGDLKNRQVICIKGSNLIIRNRSALESLISS